MADTRVLLVEGRDDEHVFYNLLEYHQVPERFKIKNKEGISKLLDTLDVELLASDLQCLGIVVDADLDINARWQSFLTILGRSGYTSLPSLPDTMGTIIQQDGKPSVGIWLMPDNTLSGMLEDFVSFLVPTDDLLWPKVERCIQDIPEAQQLFKPHFVKAYIHTWLAWQQEPGAPLGLAIKKRYLDADAPHAQTLIAWIRRLFDL